MMPSSPPDSPPVDDSAPLLSVQGLHKRFTLHAHGGVQLPAFSDVSLSVRPGECLALVGRSGSGKSSLLRCLYGNYAAHGGSMRLRHRGQWLELRDATPQQWLDVRRHTLGYVSQFLQVIPRVSTLALVAEPLRRLGMEAAQAQQEARHWLERVGLPERLWPLPPATFSGGEQQRVNIARGLIAGRPLLLLDEPTASLDVAHRDRIVQMVRAARETGAAIIGIFHDTEVRDALATSRFDLEAHRAASA